LNKLSLFRVNFTQTSEKRVHRDYFNSQSYFQYIFLKFGIGNGNEKQCSPILGLGMGMENTIAKFWDWEQE
jgi:hypothetical protein